MNSAPNLKEAEANDVLIARADARLAHAYEQIAHADEQLARVTEQLSRMEQAAVRHPSAVPDLKASRDSSTLRGLIGLLLAACIGVAAFVSQSSYGEAAKPIISRWAPYLTSTGPENSGLPAQPRPSVQLAAAEAAPQQATSSASVTAQDIAPAVAPTSSSELAQLLKEVTRVLVNVEQGVEQLKAGQEQMASNNAKVVEQLRASQEQMTRLISNTSERNVAPKTSVPPPRPNASQTAKPVPTSPQARVQPRTPGQLAPQAQ
jgi:predicted FMN-binding regulatory protein PaiB